MYEVIDEGGIMVSLDGTLNHYPKGYKATVGAFKSLAQAETLVNDKRLKKITEKAPAVKKQPVESNKKMPEEKKVNKITGTDDLLAKKGK